MRAGSRNAGATERAQCLTSTRRCHKYRHWVDRFRGDRRIQRMTCAQEGALHRLNDEAWKEGSIPSELACLADICDCSIEDMEAMWPRLAPCFEPKEDGRLVNPLLEEQRSDMDKLRVKRRDAGRLGGIAKQNVAIAKQELANAEHLPVRRGEQSREKEEESTDLALRAEPSVPTVFDLPLIRSRKPGAPKEYGVPEDLYREFISAYPGVSVMAEFGKMRAWLITNPTRRKTVKGMPAFMNSWLSKEQNNPRKGTTSGTGDQHSPAIGRGQRSDIAVDTAHAELASGLRFDEAGAGELSPSGTLN